MNKTVGPDYRAECESLKAELDCRLKSQEERHSREIEYLKNEHSERMIRLEKENYFYKQIIKKILHIDEVI